ncbi:hypothetical protein F52700_10839 [Fusarium sp. NRRL 52700]|nr:hypothetical protein F52700_10839 [Fusarium sp. NRRL 52700]
MDSFPSVEDLVKGCKSASGVTAGWDIIVSYSLKHLNSKLERLWTESLTSTTLEFTASIMSLEGEEYRIKCCLRLGTPTLQFTRDGKASLSMSLSGELQSMGRVGADVERLVRRNPLENCVLRALVPLAVVRAKSGSAPGVYDFEGFSGDVIRFDEDPDAELHIVINFGSSRAPFDIEIIPQAQEGPNPPFITDEFAFIRRLLATRISAMQFALAVVNKTPVPEATNLTPTCLSFSVYSSHENQDVACLSIYMQTEGSDLGLPPFNRTFSLPNLGNIDSFPIPVGYTASIIIRHGIFAEKCLRDSMLAAKFPGGDTNVFKSVTIMPSTEGFHLTTQFNSGTTGTFGDNFHVTNVNWDFGAKDLTFKIQGSRASWDYNLEAELGWSESSASSGGSGRSQYGRTTYKMKLAKSDLPVFEDASDEGLVARARVNSNDWETSIQAWSPSFWEIANGATGLVPDQIRNGLQRINLPSFSHALSLRYFATTNVFSPGKHMLNVNGASAVHAPYDVIILGNVSDTVA